MKGTTHMTYGVLSGLAYATICAMDINGTIITVALSTIGSMLPDIDSKTSTISNMILIPKLLPLKHRGFCHSIPLATAVTCLNVPIGLGMMSHIALDLMNHGKIKLFSPFSDKGFSLHMCKSNSTMDEFVRALGACAIVTILIL